MGVEQFKKPGTIVGTSEVVEPPETRRAAGTLKAAPAGRRKHEGLVPSLGEERGERERRPASLIRRLVDAVGERSADHFQGRKPRRGVHGGLRRCPGRHLGRHHGRHSGRACVSIGRGVQGARARDHWYGLIRARARDHWYGLIRARARDHWYGLIRVRVRGHLYGLNGLRPYTWYLYQGENPDDCTHQDPSPENACNRHESYSCNTTTQRRPGHPDLPSATSPWIDQASHNRQHLPRVLS